MIRLSALLASAALALAVTGTAQAAVVLSDTFDTEAGGGNALNYTSFANFNVIGQVDLVAPTNPYGITTASSVVDLDGTSGPGAIESKLAYAFSAGDVVTLAFTVGGSQRVTDADSLDVDFLFTGGPSLTGINGTGDYFSSPGGPTGPLAAILASRTKTSASPFVFSTLGFTALTAGAIKFRIGTSSADNIGPLLDSVSLDITAGAVPEASTWTMMIAGFGLAGAALRTRRKQGALATA